MKTVFIVNPHAGKGRQFKALVRAIQKALREYEYDVGFYTTTRPGDAERFTREYCETQPPARLIACGGDGTLNEVLNGMMGHPGFELGVLPIGTGNDFCRNFSQKEDFSDVLAQINGITTPVDAIAYTSYEGTTRYCANMCNIGFDCNVADLTATIKKNPLVSGPLAYFLAIFGTLVQKKTTNLKIELDGQLFHDGPLLLSSIANGQYCGGGIRSNPLAAVRDGKININVIYNISRLNFLRHLPFYMKGTHVTLKRLEKVIFTGSYQQIVITPKEVEMRISVDGELVTAGKTTFSVVPDAFFMVLPQKPTKTGGFLDEIDCIRENVRVGQ